jgi:sugar lactone lactonase YvrE
MKTFHVSVMVLGAVASTILLPGCGKAPVAYDVTGNPSQLLVTFDPSVTTPDGMSIDPAGALVVSCPNYADQTKPACFMRVEKIGAPATLLALSPVLPETGLSCPMGITFGPDGDLYVCDNQAWSGSEKGQFKGRLLRLKFENNKLVKTIVIAEGMEHPNGVRFHKGLLYVTQSLLTRIKDPSGLMVSGVYRFSPDDVGLKVANTLEDSNLIVKFVTKNKNCQYGVDGLVFDSKGNLFVGNFGDGLLHKITFDANGKVAGCTDFAKTDFDYSLDPKKPGFLDKAMLAKMRTTDGICIDHKDNILVADFSNNAIAKVTPEGVISVVWQNGDSTGVDGMLNEPGEPIIWKGFIVVCNFDAVFGPNHTDKVNTKADMPATLVGIPLK